MKIRLLAAALLCGTASLAHAQVQYSGPATPGHVPSNVTNNVIQDSGPATAPKATEFGLHKSGGLPFCITDSNNPPPFQDPFHQFCLAITPSQAQIIVNSSSGAPPSLVAIINGNAIPIGGGSPPVPTLTNFAQLTSGNFTNTPTLLVLGYYAINDGGGGLFQNVGNCTVDSGTCFRDSAGNFFQRNDVSHLSVLDFGCKTFAQAGNTTFDCQPAITAGINYLNTIGGPGGSGAAKTGGTLWFPAGQVFSSALTILSNVTLSGDCGGLNDIANGQFTTRLGSIGNATYFIDTNQTTPIRNAALKCMAITGQGAGVVQNAIRWNCDECLLQNLVVFNFGERGLYLQGDTTKVNFNLMYDCLLDYTSASPPTGYIGVVEVHSADNYISNNEIGPSSASLTNASAFKAALYLASGQNFVTFNVLEIADTDIADAGGNHLHGNRMDLAFGSGYVATATNGSDLNGDIVFNASGAGANQFPAWNFNGAAGTRAVNISTASSGSTTPSVCIIDTTAQGSFSPSLLNFYDAATVRGQVRGNCTHFFSTSNTNSGAFIQTPHGPAVSVPCTAPVNLESVGQAGDLVSNDATAQTCTATNPFNGYDLYWTLGPNDTFTGQTNGTFHFKFINGTWTRIQ